MKFSIKQIIFYPAVLVSIGFSAFLFYNFGNSISSKIIWLSISIIIQLFQVYTLRQYFFERNKKVRRNNLIKYLVITFFSFIATVSFGIDNINKSIEAGSGKQAEIESIDLMIREKEKVLSGFDRNEVVKKQIDMLQRRKESGSAYWENVINKQVNSLMGEMNKGNDDLVSNIVYLKMKRADLINSYNSTKGLFELLGDVFFIGEKNVKRVFLFFVAIILEVIVFTVGDFENVVIKKKVGRPRKKKRIRKFYKLF